MSIKQQLLSDLLENPNNYLSGQELSKLYNVSRNTIWKSIQQLKSEGFDIESIHNKGYRLIQIPHELNESLLKRQLPNADIYIYDSIDSTNNKAKQYCNQLKKPLALFLAKEQTHGRGRLNRTFYSPKQNGLYMSLLVKADHLHHENLHLVTHMTAVAICRAIKKITNITPDIKWVNDIFLNNKKIAGILTEAMTSIEINTIEHLIIGIGINLYQDNNTPPHLLHTIGFLSDKIIDINHFIITIIENILQLLNTLPDKSFLQEYTQHCFILNQMVTVYQHDTSYQAKALSINDNGELIVQDNTGKKQTLSFGEISIKTVR